MSIQAVKGAGAYAIQSLKNVKQNVSLLKGGVEAYKNAAIDKNIDSLITAYKPGSKQLKKAIGKVVEKATKDYPSIAKGAKKQLGVAGLIVGLAVTAGALLINKAVKSKENKEQEVPQDQKVNVVA